MKIIIIGAGLGGLSAALCFSRKGHDVTILEQRGTLTPQGSGINTRPGASRILHAWGLQKEMEAIADRTTNVSLRSLKHGGLVRSVLENVSEVPDWGTQRTNLIEMLYRKALEVGADIQFGKSVRRVSESTTEAVVELSDGAKMHADLLLAADGVRSRIRDQILEPQVEPSVSDITLYGVIVGTDRINADATRANLPIENSSLNVWMGDRAFVVGRWYHTLQVWGGLFGIQGEFSSEQKGLWDEKGDIQWVREWYKKHGICTELMAVLEMADKCDRWKLVEMPDMPTWSSKHSRILLLGDSSHAMYPNAAQGFSTIVEDIAVLDFLIDRAGENASSNITEIAQVWETVRKPRVQRIKEYAKWMTAMFLGDDLPVKPAVAKNVVRDVSQVKPDMHATFTSSAFVKWTLDFDAVEEARRYVESNKARL